MQIDLKSCSLGMELGSSRIKAVLIDAARAPLAQGEFTWENRLQNGIWALPHGGSPAGCVGKARHSAVCRGLYRCFRHEARL